MKFIELQNKDGDKILVRFREFTINDAAAIINLIRDEYGESYRKRQMYEPNYIKEQFLQDKLKMYVAELDSGEVVATLGFKRNLPKDHSGILTTGVILKKYRGYKMFFPMIRYIAAKMRKIKDISCITCISVMYHDITQRLFLRLGFTPVAFYCSLTLAKNFQHSYQRTDASKLSLGFMIRKRNQHNTLPIYIAPEHFDITKKIYSDLRVKCEILTAGTELTGESEIDFTQDDKQKSCEIEIISAGKDLVDKVREIQNKFTDDFQTFNLRLNISQPQAIAAYNALKKIGYFFTGFHPICLNYEVMILHNPMKVDLNLDSMKIVPEFEPLKNYIKNCYESRCIIV